MQTYTDKITATVDWISATFSYARILELSNSMGVENIVHALQTWLNLKATPTLGKGRHSYKYAATWDDGIAVYWGGTQAMGVHIQFQGKFIQSLKDVIELMRDILNRQGNIKRLDLAIDTTEISAADDIYNAYLRGELKTRAINVMRIQSLSGSTVYVGSRYSDQYLRVYDKGKQLNTGTLWTRIELEVKGLRALSYARVLVNQGYDAIPFLIRNFVDVPSVKWYYDALRVSKVSFGIPKVTKVHDTQAWLVNVAIPNLIREMMHDDVFRMQAIRMLRPVIEDSTLLSRIDDDDDYRYNQGKI